MNSEKYIGLDVHQATISVAVLDSTGKLVMESILETKAASGHHSSVFCSPAWPLAALSWRGIACTLKDEDWPHPASTRGLLQYDGSRMKLPIAGC